MTNQSNTPQPVLTDEEIMRSAINASDSLNITRFHGMGAPSRTIMDDAGLLELGRAIETAVLSKLRAPVADERAANGPRLRACPFCGGTPKEHDRFNSNVVTCRSCGAKVKQSAMGQGDAAERWNRRAALASAPVAGEAQPVAWVAADTLNSPHPTCISSLAYMSQIDRERGREYVPLTIIDRYAAPVAAQTADDARDAARWRTAVKNWRVKNVEVFDGVTLTNRSGIHWDDLIRQVDAAMQRTSGREGE